MMRRILASLLLVLGLVVYAVLSPLALAQTTGNRIDLYFGDWHGSTSRMTRGSLQERDIFTRGDALNPTQKAAVLRFVNAYTYATLAPYASTKATRLLGQQGGSLGAPRGGPDTRDGR